MPKYPNPHRGEMWWADLGKIKKTRPVVILQDNFGNEHFKTTVVVPCTKQFKSYQTHVCYDTPLLLDKTYIMCEDITCIEKTQLVERIQTLPIEVMREVEKVLLKNLAIKKEEPKMITANELTVFQYTGKQVRTVMKDNEPWWVLRDVCEILGLESSHKVADRLEEDERNRIPVADDLGRLQATTIINESGLYNVIIRSDKPEAKEFKRWITHDVLPSIRKTGSYVKPMSQLEILHNMTAAMLEQEKQLKAVTGTVEAIKEAVISEPDNWREDINRKLHKIAQAIGQAKYRDVYAESYKLLEQRAGVLLERRLSNKRTRMFEQGMSNTAISNACKLDVIDEDKKLREIYGKIVSEYMIKYVA